MIIDKNNPGFKKLLEAIQGGISPESNITIIEVTGRSYIKEIKKLVKHLINEQQASQSQIKIWAADKNTFRNNKVRNISDILIEALKTSNLDMKISHEKDGENLNDWLEKSPE